MQDGEWLLWNLYLLLGYGLLVTWANTALDSISLGRRLYANDILEVLIYYFALLSIAFFCITYWIASTGVIVGARRARVRNPVMLRAILVVALVALALVIPTESDVLLYYLFPVSVMFAMTARMPDALHWGLAWFPRNLLISLSAAVVLASIWSAISLAIESQPLTVGRIWSQAAVLSITVWLTGSGLIAVLWRLGIRSAAAIRAVIAIGPVLFLLLGTRDTLSSLFLLSILCGFGVVAQLPSTTAVATEL